MLPTPADRYHGLLLALDDACEGLRDILEYAAAPPPLPRQTLDTLKGIIQTMDEIRADLEDRPEEVLRLAREDQGHALLDSLERQPPP